MGEGGNGPADGPRPETKAVPLASSGVTEADGAPGAETKTDGPGLGRGGTSPASSPCGPTGPLPSTLSHTRPWGGWTCAGQIGEEGEVEPELRHLWRAFPFEPEPQDEFDGSAWRYHGTMLIGWW